MKFSEVYPALPLLEMLDTTFDTLSWSTHDNGVEGVGSIGDFQVKLTLTSVTYAELDGVNVTFAVYDGAKYTEVFQNADTKNSALLIGAVTNALKDKLSEFEWDFVLLVAKDNISSRSKLYPHIAKRISKERGLGYVEFNVRNSHITLLTSLPADETRSLVDNIINS